MRRPLRIGMGYRKGSASKWSSGGATLDAFDADMISCWKLANVNDSFASQTLTNVGSIAFDQDGVSGKCAEFDGTSKRLTFGTDNQNTGAFSISCAFYLDSSIDNTYSCIYEAKHDNVGFFMQYQGDSNDNKLYIANRGIGGFLTDASFTRDAWNYLLVTYNGGDKGSTGSFKVYRNASSLGLTGVGIGGSFTTNSIGTDSSGSQMFGGKIDEVVTWGIDIGQDGATALYNSGTGAFWTP